MPDLSWNEDAWNSNYDWKLAGEEWSEGWGGSTTQWFGSILPRIHRFFPATRVLEIAPGHGRWTKFLVSGCEEYLGVDMSVGCIESCKIRFGAHQNASFKVNDGMSLAVVPDGHYDFVFSYDSLVHAEIDVMKSYAKEIVKKLTPTGAAFIHHSNLLAFNGSIGSPHHRASSVSGDSFAAAIDEAGGRLLVQELINWGGVHTHDALTLFCQKGAAIQQGDPVCLFNPHFMEEAALIKNFQSPYSSVGLKSKE